MYIFLGPPDMIMGQIMIFYNDEGAIIIFVKISDTIFLSV